LEWKNLLNKAMQKQTRGWTGNCKKYYRGPPRPLPSEYYNGKLNAAEEGERAREGERDGGKKD
jgi:hypothetical protein